MCETDDRLRISLIFLDQFMKSQSQSQNLITILKVSVSVSKIETGYTECQSQSQHAKTGLAHPCINQVCLVQEPNFSSLGSLEV